MVIPSERRRPEARSLRQFFQEQMSLLLQALGGPVPVPGSGEDVEAAIERLVAGTDPRLRVLGDYRRRLREGTRGLLDHVERTVAEIPPERAVDPPSFANDSLVNALFVSVAHMAQVVSASHSVQEYLGGRPGGSVHGALYVTRKDKRVLRTVLQDDLLVRDVPRVAVNFTDHQVRHPGPAEDAVRARLRQELFESLVRELRARMYRHCREEASGTTASAPLEPAKYLRHLGQVLGRPGQLLTLEWQRLRLTRDSILAERSDPEVAHDLEFPELRLAGLPGRALVLVRIPQDIIMNRARLLAQAERVLNIQGGPKGLARSPEGGAVGNRAFSAQDPLPPRQAREPASPDPCRWALRGPEGLAHQLGPGQHRGNGVLQVSGQARLGAMADPQQTQAGVEVRQQQAVTEGLEHPFQVREQHPQVLRRAAAQPRHKQHEIAGGAPTVQVARGPLPQGRAWQQALSRRGGTLGREGFRVIGGHGSWASLVDSRS